MRSKLRIYPTPGLSLLLCSGSGGILVWDGSAELWANIHWPCVASCLCWIIAEPTRHRLRWLLKITVALERGWDHDGCAGIAAPQISSELAEHPAAPLSPPAHPSELLTWAFLQKYPNQQGKRFAWKILINHRGKKSRNLCWVWRHLGVLCPVCGIN